MRILASLLAPFSVYFAAVTDVASYPKLADLRTREKVGILLTCYALLAGLATAHFGFTTLPQHIEQWRETWQEFRRSWPENLTVRYEGGHLTAEPNEPLALPYPAQWRNVSGLPQYFLRLDTRPEAENQQDSLAFVTAESITTRTVTGTERTALLTDALGTASWRLDQSALAEFEPTLEGIFTAAPPSLLMGEFLWKWLGLLVLRLAGLLLYAWIAQALLSLLGTPVSYRRSYALGMMALLPAETLQTLINILYSQPLGLFWWSWLAMMLIIGWLNRGRLR